MDTPVLGQILVLFVLMGAGFLSSKLKITTKEGAALFSAFVMKITLPCLIIDSFQRPYSSELLGEIGVALVVSFVIFGVCFFIGWAYPYLLKIKSPERGVHSYALFISNSGFMGYPVIEAVMGSFYLFHAVIFNVPFSFLAFSLGAWLIAKESGKARTWRWKNFISVPMVFTVIGFGMFFFSIKLPGPLAQGIALIGDITTPLSMAVIGISIANADVKKLFGRWQVYVTVLVRLLVLPALTVFFCYMVGIRGPFLTFACLITAMPAGSTTSLLASLYDVAVEEAGSLVALSTVASAATIPLAVFALHFFAE